MSEPFDIFDAMLTHNRWAMEELLRAAAPLTAEQFDASFDIGPGSVRAALSHVIGAMARWADRLVDRPLRAVDDDAEGEPSIEQLARRLAHADEDLRASVASLRADDRLGELMVFGTAGDGDPYHFTRGAAILHVATHGVHHRAQVLNMLRRLGAPVVPDLDAIESELRAGR
jgi:uncharacterized damage-inducible protein DinB